MSSFSNPHYMYLFSLKNGKKRLTYGGHPLYTYGGDSGPGQTFYVNFLQFGGRWPAVNAAGGEVK